MNIQIQKSDSTKHKWQIEKSDNFDPQFSKLALPLSVVFYLCILYFSHFAAN